MQGPSSSGLGDARSAPRTHPLALASLISAVLGCCCPVVPAVLAVVLGVIASNEIRDKAQLYSGRELAVLGVVLGGLLLALQLVGTVLMFAFGMNPDRISALIETPPAEVFYENNLPPDGEAFLRDNAYVAPDERILLYYDDSFMEKFAAISALTNRRVLTVFDREVAWIDLPDVTRVRYVPGSLTEDYVIHVHGRGDRHLALIFTQGAAVRDFADRITELVALSGGARLAVE